MKTGFAVSLAVVGVVSLGSLYAVNYQNTGNVNFLQQDDYEFVKFAAEFGKSYATKEEYEVKREIFQANFEKVIKSNSANGNTFTLKVNKFAVLTDEEYSNLLSYKLKSKPSDKI